MAQIQFLTILLTVTCFLGGVVSVTDKELTELKEENAVLSRQVKQLQKNEAIIMGQIERQNLLIRQLLDVKRDVTMETEHSTETRDTENLIQNVTIEERVALLEIQMMEVEGDVTLLEGDVNFLFDEQVIQDERIFILEQTSIEIDENVEDLQATTMALDFRVTVLEENGGGDGNSSVAELEVRVETLEETAFDHETRISTAESDLTDLDEAVTEQDTRLTAAEETIQGLQMTDVELDTRITALEENGGGNTQNATIAFTTALTATPSIPDESAVLFNVVLLNEGDGYDSTTGTFTVPSGGDGLYYFYVYFAVIYYEVARFEIRINGEVICHAYGDALDSTNPDPVHASCGGAAIAAEGDTVQVIYTFGTDSTPLISGSFYNHGFTGFRI